MRFRLFNVVLMISVGLLFSCSPQQRLSYLLKKHPELCTNTKAIPVHIDIPLPAAKESVNISWGAVISEPLSKTEIRTGDSTTAAHPHVFPIHNSDVSNHSNSNTDKFSVVAGRAKAELQITDSGVILTAEQLPDTIPVDTVAHVPEVEARILPVEESGIKKFFRHFGILSFIVVVIIVIVVTIVITRRVIKI